MPRGIHKGYRGHPGVKHHDAKLTPYKVRRIRRLRAQGVPGIELAKHYGVSPSRICEIYKRKTWKHIK